ncbi:hypothetical protein HYV80_06600 [Candidatus Woesearchaeota archaeon]|nr:hypothetical protein [Candidatus Woesearchaeota archaeon]
MKKAKRSGFVEWNNNVLLSSMKRVNHDLIPIIALDALFYILSGYAVMLWFQRVQAKMASFNVPADIMSLGMEKARQFAGDVKTFYFLVIASFILLLIAIIFLASILKGMIWAKTTGTKISFKLISKFFGLNMAWMGFWLILVFLISYAAEPGIARYLMAAAILLGLYFTNTLYTFFMREQSFKSILKAIKLNVSKIHLFLLPYSAILLLLYVIIRLGSMMKFAYSPILLGAALLIYSAVIRHYASALAEEAENL